MLRCDAWQHARVPNKPQTFGITEAIAKRRRRDLLLGLGACSPQKISKSRRSEMPFLAFPWWYFPQTYSKSELTSTASCLLSVLLFLQKISTVSFKNKILESLKSYFSIRGGKYINLVKKCTSSSVLSGAEVNSLLKASLLFGES